MNHLVDIRGSVVPYCTPCRINSNTKKNWYLQFLSYELIVLNTVFKTKSFYINICNFYVASVMPSNEEAPCTAESVSIWQADPKISFVFTWHFPSACHLFWVLCVDSVQLLHPWGKSQLHLNARPWLPFSSFLTFFAYLSRFSSHVNAIATKAPPNGINNSIWKNVSGLMRFSRHRQPFPSCSQCFTGFCMCDVIWQVEWRQKPEVMSSVNRATTISY